MKTLVLCVDRDDDLGEKANITSPIIGRKDNLRAAIALGITDPEDSDTNSILAAIKIYDSLVDDNEEAEIATITGHKIVGKRSDTILADQFNTLMKVVKPDSVILVSDGREDEFIEPIISSRVNIRSVHRVIIKQAKDVESIVYTVLSAFQNEKILKKFVIPLGLVFLTYGILALLDLTHVAIGVLAVVIGLYLLMRAFHLEDPLGKVWAEFIANLEARRYIALFSIFISLASFGLGIALGINMAYGQWQDDNAQFIFLFTKYSAGWIISAGIIYVLGNSLDLYIRKKRAPRFTGTFASVLFAAMFLAYGVLEVVGANFFDEELNITLVVILGMLFIICAFVFFLFRTYQKLMVGKTKEPWRR